MYFRLNYKNFRTRMAAPLSCPVDNCSDSTSEGDRSARSGCRKGLRNTRHPRPSPRRSLGSKSTAAASRCAPESCTDQATGEAGTGRPCGSQDSLAERAKKGRGSSLFGFCRHKSFPATYPPPSSPAQPPERAAHVAARPSSAALQSPRNGARPRRGVKGSRCTGSRGGAERGSTGPKTGFVNIRQFLPLPSPPFSDRVPAPMGQRGRQNGRRRGSEGALPHGDAPEGLWEAR